MAKVKIYKDEDHVRFSCGRYSIEKYKEFTYIRDDSIFIKGEGIFFENDEDESDFLRLISKYETYLRMQRATA